VLRQSIQGEKMTVQTDITPRYVRRRHDGGLKCSAIADENHLLLRSRHRGVKQRPIKQTALGNRDDDAAELGALSLVGGDSVGKSQVLEAAFRDQVLLVVEVDIGGLGIGTSGHQSEYSGHEQFYAPVGLNKAMLLSRNDWLRAMNRA